MKMEELMLNAKSEAGRQALGLVGRADVGSFYQAFSDFKEAFKFLKEEFEAAVNGVADPPDGSGEPNA